MTRPRRTALGVAVTTAACMVVPLWLLFSHGFRAIAIADRGLWIAVPVGLTALLLVLAAASAVWAAAVARSAATSSAPVITATMRTAIPLTLPVAVGIDLTQLLLTTVGPWHRLAVHVLFGVAFATGLAVFLAVVCREVWLAVERVGGEPECRASAARVGRRVALASAVGVAVCAVVAVPLGWTVVRGMGMRMLWPLYLVVGGAGGGGGAVFGWALAARPRSQTPATPNERDRASMMRVHSEWARRRPPGSNIRQGP